MIERNISKDLILNLDAQRIQEVFLNLMMKAIQAIQTLPGHIRISAAADESEVCGIITVEDTGGGIPEKNFSHIFDPFFTTKMSAQEQVWGFRMSLRMPIHLKYSAGILPCHAIALKKY